jgi:glycosyltransferase involved in cell wall biosynthesis
MLVISRRFWPDGGGAELATHLIVDLLAREEEYAITVATGTQNPARTKNVNYITHPGLGMIGKPSSWLQSRLPSVQTCFGRLMKRFDLVYICQSYPLIPLAKHLDRKVVVHLHDYQPISYNSIVLAPAFQQHLDPLNQIFSEAKFEILEHQSPFKAFTGSLLAPTVKLYRHWMNEADTVICVSRRQAIILSHFAHELEPKIRIAHNPLPPVPLIEKKDVSRPPFLYAGGDSYVKGFRTFLDASQKLLQKNPDVRFILTKEFRATNMRLLKRLNAISGGLYTLSGHVGYDELMKLRSITRGLIFPSIWEETWGYAVMEALLSGTIPISSRVGGVVELVEGTSAEDYLFEPGNADDLANKMTKVASFSSTELNDIGKELRESILSKYDTGNIRQDLLAALE